MYMNASIWSRDRKWLQHRMCLHVLTDSYDLAILDQNMSLEMSVGIYYRSSLRSNIHGDIATGASCVTQLRRRRLQRQK